MMTGPGNEPQIPYALAGNPFPTILLTAAMKSAYIIIERKEMSLTEHGGNEKKHQKEKNRPRQILPSSTNIVFEEAVDLIGRKKLRYLGLKCGSTVADEGNSPS